MPACAIQRVLIGVMVYVNKSIKIRLKISRVVIQESSQNHPDCGFDADNKTLVL